MIIKKLKTIIKSIEEGKLTLKMMLATFLSIVIFRTFLESFSNGQYKIIEYSAAILHFPLFFASVLFSMIFILRFFSREGLIKISRIALIGWLVSLTPPIVDLIVSKGQGFLITYILQGPGGMLRDLFTFFGPNIKEGITYGVRAQVILAIVFVGAYVFLKTKNYLKSFFAALSVYLVIFLYGIIPSLVTLFLRFSKGFNLTDIDVVQEFLVPRRIFSLAFRDPQKLFDVEMAIILFIILVFQLAVWYFLFNREKFKTLLSNIRPLRCGYHLGLLGLGLSLGFFRLKVALDFSFFGILALIILGFSVLFSWLSAMFRDDISDFNLDRVSNRKRPLVQGKFSQSEYEDLGLVFFILACASAFILGYPFLILILVYQALTFIYSNYPLRLKRFPIIATLAAAFCSLVIVFMGFILNTQNQSLIFFPFNVGFLLLVGLTLSLPAKDLKDVGGDRIAGVKTLPVIFGKEKGRLIIGSLVFCSFILSPLFLRSTVLILPALLFGVIGFFLVRKIKPEHLLKYLFAVFIVYVVILLFLVR